jgi:hypothetical protein
MEYSEEVFAELFLAIRGEQTAFRWLMENDYKELGAFTMALGGKPDAYKWLEQNGFNSYSLLIKAAKRHTPSFNALAGSQDKELACVVGVINRDNNCRLWLQEHSYPELIDLAQMMRNKLDLTA